MKKSVAVIGLGRFGMSLATTLHDSDYEVLAIDKVAEITESIGSRVTHAVRADATNEAVLQKLGITGFDVVVVAIGAAIQDSVLTTILLKKLGVPHVVARADNELHGSILEKIGADKVIFPERDTAIRTAPTLTMKSVMDYIPLGNGSGIVKVQAPPHFVGKTPSDLGFGTDGKRGVVVLMIQRGKEGILNPGGQEVVSRVDVLIIAGNNLEVEKLLAETENPEHQTSNATSFAAQS